MRSRVGRVLVATIVALVALTTVVAMRVEWLASLDHWLRRTRTGSVS